MEFKVNYILIPLENKGQPFEELSGPSAESSAQYSVMVYVEKESEREWMCMTESLCCTAEMITTL